uniref:Uncharacterized protein n=1 Tax=Utricularia reniformis TaxID=192314 RepID=A0A1Y0B3M6_9LAMI|nr:hypothetical protein AEK19_MT1827 [Utricularia reniformis]ART31998.1 hypothetical protein AEK19_MT1827 [Utricularia reniformis]
MCRRRNEPCLLVYVEFLYFESVSFKAIPAFLSFKASSPRTPSLLSVCVSRRARTMNPSPLV